MTQSRTQAPGAGEAPHNASADPVAVDLACEVARLRRENERLRMERDILKSRAHLRIGLPMKFGFVDEHRTIWPVRVMCAALSLSVSGYYYAWRACGRRAGAPATTGLCWRISA